MRDRNPSRDEPSNWSDAFNRMPMESPERDIWSRLALEIQPPARPRKRRLRWAAAAAVAALAIALPLAWLARDAAQPPLLTTQSPLPPASNIATPTPTRVSPVQAIDDPPVTFASESARIEHEPAHVSTPAAKNERRLPPRQVAAMAPEHARTVSRPTATVDAAGTGADSLPGLYAESAQLEAMLAQVQDDRVSSGPAAALAAQYESRLATIDASLADAALPDDLRTTLWSERVDALRELVGFEATQRWLNARGERYDGQLVAVY